MKLRPAVGIIYDEARPSPWVYISSGQGQTPTEIIMIITDVIAVTNHTWMDNDPQIYAIYR
jgi:hypothetical protein